jgi:hypothetical protein
MKATFCKLSLCHEMYVYNCLPDLEALQVHCRLLATNTPLVSYGTKRVVLGSHIHCNLSYCLEDVVPDDNETNSHSCKATDQHLYNSFSFGTEDQMK